MTDIDTDLSQLYLSTHLDLLVGNYIGKGKVNVDLYSALS